MLAGRAEHVPAPTPGSLSLDAVREVLPVRTLPCAMASSRQICPFAFLFSPPPQKCLATFIEAHPAKHIRGEGCRMMSFLIC